MELIEMIVTDSFGRTGEKVENDLIGKIVTPALSSSSKSKDMYRFYAAREITPFATKEEDLTPAPIVTMVMPVGGEMTGLYRFPHVGEKVLVGASRNSLYLMGYLPSVDQNFSEKEIVEGNSVETENESVIDKDAQVLRYKKAGENSSEKLYSEIGFYQEKTQWKEKGKTKEDDPYPKVDQLKLTSTGDIHSEAENFHRIKAKRLAILANCDEKDLNSPIEDGKFFAGDIFIRSNNHLEIKAKDKITLKVGRSSIVISEDGVSISSRKASGSYMGPWDSNLNVTARAGISMTGQSLAMNSVFGFSLIDNFGANISSIGGILRMSGVDVKMYSLPIPAYVSTFAGASVKYFSQMASFGCGMNEATSIGADSVPSIMGTVTDVAAPLIGAIMKWNSSDGDADDLAGALHLYVGLILKVIDALAMTIDSMLVSDKIKRENRDNYRDGLQVAFTTIEMGTMIAVFTILLVVNDNATAIKPYVQTTYTGDVDISAGAFTSTVVRHTDAKSPFAGYDGNERTDKREAKKRVEAAKEQAKSAQKAYDKITNGKTTLAKSNITSAQNELLAATEALNAMGISSKMVGAAAGIGVAVLAAAIAIYCTVGMNKIESDAELQEELLAL